MADHSIRIGIDSREAEAGAKRVTRSLDEIKAAAIRATGKPINVEIRGEQAERAAAGLSRTFRQVITDGASLSGRPFDVRLGTVDAQRAAAGLSTTIRQLQAEGDRLDGVSVRLESSGADAALDDIRAVGEAADRLSGRTVRIDADDSGLESAMRTLRSLAEETARAEGRRIGLELDASAVDAAVADVMVALDDLRRMAGRGGGTVEMRADTADLRTEIGRVNALIAELKASGGADVTVDADTSRARVAFTRLGEDVARLRSSSQDGLAVDVDAAPALAELRTLAAEAVRLSALRVGVEINDAAVEAAVADMVDDLRVLRREAAAADGIEVDVGLDAAALRDGVDKLRRAVADLRAEAGTPTSVSVDVDPAALGDLTSLREAVAALDERVTFSADVDTAAARREVAALGDALAELRARLNVSPDLDTTAARREIAVLGDILADLRSRTDLSVDLDADAALRKLRALATELVRLTGRREGVEIPTAAAEASAEEMIAAFRDVRREADALDGTSVGVTLDAAALRRGIAEVSRALDDLRREDGAEIPISFDTTGMSAAVDRVGRLLREITARSGDTRIPLAFDLEGIDEETADIIRRIKDQIDRNLEAGVSVEASLDVVTGAALAEVDRFVAQASRPVGVPVSADTAQAEAAVDALRDRLARVLPRDGLRVRIGGDASGAVDAAREAAEALDGVSEAAERVSGIGSFKLDFGNFVSSAKRAVQELVNFQKEGRKLPQVASEAQTAWRQFFQEMETAEIAIETIGATAVAIADAITGFEDMESSLQAVTGTALKAENAFGVIRDFARDTPFQIQDVTDAFVALKSQGLDANREAMTGYGNMASALNLTLKEMGEAVADAAGGDFDKLNETQVKAERQGNRVILTYRGMRTEVENTSRAVAQALQDMGNTTFARGMEEAAEGVGSAFDRVKDAATEFSNAIGAGGLNTGLENFSDALTRAMEGGKEFAALFGSFLGSALNDLAVAVKSTANEINMLTSAWNTGINAVRGYYDAVKDYLGLGPVRGPAPPSVPASSEDPIDAAIRQEGLDALDLNLGDPREKQAPFIREGVFLQKDDKGKFQTKSNGLSLTAPDDRDEKRVSRGRSRGNSQAEAYRRESTALKAQVDMLRLTDEAYDRGRTAVEQYRNSMEELSAKLSLNESVGKKNAQSLVDLTMDAKDLQETLAFKGAVLDMTEQIGQAEALATAFGEGAGAARDQEAANNAWNKAVQLGRAGREEAVQQLYGLEKASQAANAKLAAAQGLAQFDVEISGLEAMVAAYQEGGDAIRQAAIEQETLNFALQAGLSADDPMVAVIRERITALQDLRAEQALAQEMAGMDREITSLEDMADAYREGGGAVRDTTIAQEAYATAVRLGVEHDDASRRTIEAKTRALYDMREANETARRSMEVGFDLEQAERELSLIGMTGEARYIEAERIELLMDKKRRLGDATATLTAEEEQLAVAMAQVTMASQAQNSELQRLATSIPDMAAAWDMAAAGSLMHFEDALVDIVTGAKSAREAFADMAKSIAADLARMAIRMAIIQPLAMMFGGGFGGGVAAPMFGGFVSQAAVGPINWRHTGGVVGVDPAPTGFLPAFHTGGVVGAEVPGRRALPPISSWTRLHAGGLAGNEVPTILEKGEAVLTPGQMKMLGPAAGGGTTNNITVNVSAQQGVSDADAERQGRIIAQQIEQSINSKLIKELRPGGILSTA